MGRIIFHFFNFYYAEMRKKLWLKAPAKEPKSYTAKLLYLFFWFFIVYLPKKNENWKMAQGCRLSPCNLIVFVRKQKLIKLDNHMYKRYFLYIVLVYRIMARIYSSPFTYSFLCHICVPSWPRANRISLIVGLYAIIILFLRTMYS